VHDADDPDVLEHRRALQDRGGLLRLYGPVHRRALRGADAAAVTGSVVRRLST
jgi:hypothetical protein